MDEIQKTLVKAGRKDLAIKYYKKISAFADEKKLATEIKKNLEAVAKNLKQINKVSYDKINKLTINENIKKINKIKKEVMDLFGR